MINKTIFILGTGHCGSTLLDLILGSHSKMFSLGEVYRLVSSELPDTICDICEEECRFWKMELVTKLRKAYKPNLAVRIGRKMSLIEMQEVFFYRALFQASKKDILVDSSKNPGWIKRNGKALQSSSIKPILLYLSRDGRAVVNSYFRKYPERGLEPIANNWNSRISAINECYTSWPSENRIHIRYEELAKEPRETIKKIMDFIQTPYEEEMMRFWEKPHHLVNGNAGTKSMLLKFRDKHRHEQWIHTNEKDYYKNQELGIKFDERWRKELNLEQIASIESIINNLNCPLKE